MESERIESKVLGLPGFKALKPPPDFAVFFEEIAPALAFSDLAVDALGTFKTAQARVLLQIEYIERRKEDKDNFIQMVRSRAQKNEDLTIEQAIRLYGTSNTTDFIMAMEICHLIRGSFWDKRTHTAPDDLSELTKFARTAQEAMGEDKPYSNLAYAGGLLFDILAAVVKKNHGVSEKFQKYIATVFRNGVETAEIGYNVAKLIPKVKLIHYVFSTCLIHDVGKIVMAYFNEDYEKFSENFADDPWTRSFRESAESFKFGIGHPIYSFLVCRYYRPLMEVHDAVLFHHHPYLAPEDEQKRLSRIVSLASNVSHYRKQIKDIKDANVDRWIRPETDPFPLEKEQIFNQVNSTFK